MTGLMRELLGVAWAKGKLAAGAEEAEHICELGKFYDDPDTQVPALLADAKVLESM